MQCHRDCVEKLLSVPIIKVLIDLINNQISNAIATCKYMCESLSLFDEKVCLEDTSLLVQMPVYARQKQWMACRRLCGKVWHFLTRKLSRWPVIILFLQACHVICVYVEYTLPTYELNDQPSTWRVGRCSTYTNYTNTHNTYIRYVITFFYAVNSIRAALAYARCTGSHGPY